MENQIITGRIEALENKKIYLTRHNEHVFFELIQKPDDLRPGDIVQLEIKNNIAITACLLNRPLSNPAADRNSCYYKYHKNNQKMRDVLWRRQDFFMNIRNFFRQREFLEIHTPVLVQSPGVEYHIEPFSTTYLDYENKKQNYYLPTSPEFSLKEVLTAGVEKIFEIAKVFRNKGEASELHRPEFFMLEWYRAYEDYTVLMEDCFQLLLYLSRELYNNTTLERDGRTCRLEKLEKIKVRDLFLKYNINLDYYTTAENKFVNDVRAVLNLSKQQLNEMSLTKEDLFFKLFLSKIEPELGFDRPVIVHDYPLEMTLLSRPCSDNPLYGERFELYLFGIEIANAFGELIDPLEQERRFKSVLQYRKNNCYYPLNQPERFLNALKQGLPPCSGIALGIERLFMIFENLSSIYETNIV